MSQSNNTPHDPFEAQLSNLLAQTANDLRPAGDFARNVRRRALAGDFSRSARPELGFTLPSLKPLGSVALITLVVCAMVWLLAGPGIKGLHFSPLGTQPGGSSPPQNCDNSSLANMIPSNTPSPLDDSIAIGASASLHGITYTIDRAYADATQTVVTYHETAPANVVLSDGVAAIEDAAGARYGTILSEATGGPSEPASQPGHFVAAFAPLPQSELGTPQHLAVVVTGVRTMPATPLTPGVEVVRGPLLTGEWRMSFTITPVEGNATLLSLPAQTHDGVTIQPEAVDSAPTGGGLDGKQGGIRVRFRVSGLPAAMPIYDAAHYSYFFQAGPNGDSLGTGCAATLTLRLPAGKTLIPGAVIVPAQYVGTSDSDAELA
ncbi:MAG TPA: hypothetical protein VID72_09955, partial [Ktedonobacterales bacterium]